MTKPILYVESLSNSKRLAFDFCYSAMMGAEQAGIAVRSVPYSDDIPLTPTNILVGSVEFCCKWLNRAGIITPTAVDINLFPHHANRITYIKHISEIDEYPIFIKPYETIKAFTGFVATDKMSKQLWSEMYDGLVCTQPVLDIVSEYRVYVTNHKLLDIKHYGGDPLAFPFQSRIKSCLQRAREVLTHHSYTLDIGVLSNGSTILVEVNDGWACGNYGLPPDQYYQFVKNRWLQLTGIRTKMDYIHDYGY